MQFVPWLWLLFIQGRHVTVRQGLKILKARTLESEPCTLGDHLWKYLPSTLQESGMGSRFLDRSPLRLVNGFIWACSSRYTCWWSLQQKVISLWGFLQIFTQCNVLRRACDSIGSSNCQQNLKTPCAQRNRFNPGKNAAKHWAKKDSIVY